MKILLILFVVLTLFYIKMIIANHWKNIVKLHLKTYKKITEDRIHKLNLQLEIYKRLAEETFNKPCQCIGGLIFENYAKAKQNTNLVFIKAQDASKEVDDILNERLKEMHE